MTRTYQEITADVRQHLDALRQAMPRMSAAARRATNKKLKEINEGITRQQAAAYQRATQNSNGGNHIEDAALPNLTVEAPPISPNRAERTAASGGERRPEGWLRGVPFYRQDEDGDQYQIREEHTQACDEHDGVAAYDQDVEEAP